MTSTILLVDDYPDAVDVLALYLKGEGFEVLTANDGANALAEAMRSRPHLIVMDLEMPVLSGYEVAARLRQQAETRDIPLIAATGHSHARQLEDAVTGGLRCGDRQAVRPRSSWSRRFAVCSSSAARRVGSGLPLAGRPASQALPGPPPLPASVRSRGLAQALHMQDAGQMTRFLLTASAAILIGGATPVMSAPSTPACGDAAGGTLLPRAYVAVRRLEARTERSGKHAWMDVRTTSD